MEIVFKDLSIEELTHGYINEDQGNTYKCIFCGETFEKGIIYNSRDRMVDANRGVIEHVFDAHGGSFNALILLDKQINGLTEVQKSLLNCMYKDDDNKVISKEMNISPTTVRAHKFNLQKMKREAKILLALLEQVENEELALERKKYEKEEIDLLQEIEKISKNFSGNTLHPFFTQCNLK